MSRPEEFITWEERKLKKRQRQVKKKKKSNGCFLQRQPSARNVRLFRLSKDEEGISKTQRNTEELTPEKKKNKE